METENQESYSSIDHLLSAQSTPQTPKTSESEYSETPASEVSVDAHEPVEPDSSDMYDTKEPAKSEADAEPEKAAPDLDDYGNEKTPPKTYSEDEVNERINAAIRDRLSRLERNNQPPPTPTQVQQAQQGFEYNADNPESWQQQLESFVEQTVTRMTHKQATAAQQRREAHAQAAFESKFHEGMTKFKDYSQVVGSQPVTDHMVIATRAMRDPAAFLYAAARQTPEELKRISNIDDPVSQMVEIGRLEERLRKSKAATNTPKPDHRTQADASIPHKEDKEPSIEELIASAEARKRALLMRRK